MDNEINHSGRAHALLSPSAAHRWMNCPACVALEARYPDTATSYAEEGTRAHELCERKLRGLAIEAEADMEMEEAADLYVEEVRAALEEVKRRTPDAQLMVEVRLDLQRYVPQCYGTADAVIVGDGVLHVFDFKYGKGVKVNTVGNEQLSLYGLGALEALDTEYHIEDVVLHIVQPRLGNVSTWQTDAKALRKFGSYARMQANKALNGAGAKAKAGDWCRFCKARGECRALAEACRERVGKQAEEPRLLSAQETALLLGELPMIKAWAAALEEAALSRALKGETLPGWKLVEGRSTRRVSDAPALMERLRAAGFEEAQYMKAPELQTLTTLEKMVGKKAFAEMSAGLIEKPAGKPALAPETDKRPAWNAAEADFKEF